MNYQCCVGPQWQEMEHRGEWCRHPGRGWRRCGAGRWGGTGAARWQSPSVCAGAGTGEETRRLIWAGRRRRGSPANCRRTCHRTSPSVWREVGWGCDGRQHRGYFHTRGRWWWLCPSTEDDQLAGTPDMDFQFQNNINIMSNTCIKLRSQSTASVLKDLSGEHWRINLLSAGLASVDNWSRRSWGSI